MGIFNTECAFDAFQNAGKNHPASNNSLSTQQASAQAAASHLNLSLMEVEAIRSIVFLSAVALRWFLTKKTAVTNRFKS